MTPTPLFPYQERGVQALVANPRFLLADDMGLGKTPQAIRAADALGLARLLVVCPAIARVNWARELTRFGLLPRRVHLVTNGKAAIPPDAETVVVNYDLLAKRRAELMSRDWDVLILDEAHYAKSPTAARTQAITGSRRTGPGIVTKCQRVWCLTGTPMPNNASELWVMARSFLPEVARRLGITSYDAWLDRFTVCRDTDWGKQPFRSKNLPVLNETLAPYMLRRKKKDVLHELPALRFDTWTVEADAAALKAARMQTDSKQDLKRLDQAFAEVVGEDIEDYDPLALSSLRRLIGRLKAKPVAELLAERLTADPTEKAIVFAVHRDVLDLLQAALRPFGLVRVDGGVMGAKRQQAIDGFQTDPGTRIFLGQLTACSTAITLTAGSVVVFAEASWVPAENEQGFSRAYRIGQRRSVEVIYTSLAGSIDEAVTGVLIRKSAEIRDFFAAVTERGVPGSEDDVAVDVAPSPGKSVLDALDALCPM